MDTGWLSPTNNSYLGSPYFSLYNPTYAYSADGNYAIGTHPESGQKFGGFGVSLPPGAIVEGLEIRALQYQTLGMGYPLGDVGLFPVLDGVTFDDILDGGYIHYETSNLSPAEYVVAGRPSDLWTIGLTKADVENPNFGVGFTWDWGTFAQEIYLDHIEIKIYYSGGEPVPRQGFVQFNNPANL